MPSCHRLSLVAGLVALGLVNSSAALAARPEISPPVANSPAEAARDYDLLGEYVGWVSGGYRRERVGIQLYTTSPQAFHGVEYGGGLPGAGWDRQHKRPLAGTWRGGVARLEGDGRRLVVAGGKLWIYDAGGVLRGALAKVERQSPTLGLAPPPGAIVLFNGTTDELDGARVTDEGLLAEGARTKRAFQDFRMHVEFRLPYMPAGEDQARANSGVYLQERYEVQILDSFGLEGLANQCGGLYKQRPPAENLCLPPLVWQTYEIEFRSARFDATGNKTANARITLRHNGVTVHDDVELTSKTGNGKPEGPEPRPIIFQNHGNPVRYRNIWLLELSDPAELPAPAAMASPKVSGGRLSSVSGGREPPVEFRLISGIIRSTETRNRGLTPSARLG